MTRVGNLRGAPLFLRPSVVRGLVEGVEAIRKGMVQVPVAPIKLVDVPRRSEDPRLAKANDDCADVSGASGWVAPPVASEPEDWPDAPLPDHADPDLDRPEPVDDQEAVGAAARVRVRKSRATGVKAAAEAARAERNAQLLAAMRAGESVDALAERFGLSTWTVREVGYAEGIKRRKGPKKSPEIAERNRRVLEAFAADEPVAEIMARFGINRASVYKIAEKAGLKRPVEDRSARNEAVCAAYAAGDELEDIAARFNLKVSSIYQLAKKAGVKRPKPVKAMRAPELARPSAAPKQIRLPMHPLPQVADQPLPAPAAPAPTGPGFYSEAATKRRLQDAGRHRARAEQSEVKAKRIARRAERVAEVDAAAAEFAAALERVRARRAEGVEVIVRKPAPPVNAGARLAEAIRLRDARKAQATAPAKRPIERAPSREECPRCGVPGWKGCQHQLPFIDMIDPASLGQPNSGPRV